MNNTRTNKKRDQLVNYLKKNKVIVGINYRCVTDMSYYRRTLKWNSLTCKIGKKIGDNILSLPLHAPMTKNDIIYITKKIKKFFEN